MCIQIQVSYPRCSHIHLGYELCVDIDSKHAYCSSIQTHLRIDSHCPQCSKLESRAHKHQSACHLRALKSLAPKGSRSTSAIPASSRSLTGFQLQARYEREHGKGTSTDERSNSSRERTQTRTSPSPTLSAHSYTNAYIPPPSPIEPSIGVGGVDSHEYWQKAALLGARSDFNPRSRAQENLRSSRGSRD